MMELVLAIVFGTAFGFVLQRAAAADPDMIIDMLRLRNMHLMKVILSAIGLASIALFSGLALGVVDASHLSVKASYWGVLLGGAMLGFGWALSGFCPGTALVAGGSGRKDAWFFVFGGLLGAGIFTLVFGAIESTWLFGEIAGGKTTLANTSVTSTLVESLPGVAVAGLLGVVLIAIAVAVPKRLR